MFLLGSFETYVSVTCALRTLDADLSTVMKAGEEFDWQRIPFILEACVTS